MTGSYSRRALLALSTAAILSINPTTSIAQDAWPKARPIKFVVPFPAGGNADAIARLFADKMSAGLGQSIVIENRGGAAGAIGGQAVARAEPDGYTWLFSPSSVLVIGPHIRKAGYDPIADFIPVAIASRSYGIAAVRKDLPANTLKEFVALAKKDPDKYNFGSAGFASSTHIAGEIFHSQAGIKVTHVAYKGSADALTDLMGGRIDVLYDPVAFPQVESGNVKALAIMGDVRHPLLPNVPTSKEEGFPILSNVWFGLFAPKGTPKEMVDRVAAEAQKVAAQNDVKTATIKFSQYVDFGGPKEADAAVKADSAFYKDLVQRLNLAEK